MKKEDIGSAFQDLYRYNRAYKLTDDGKMISVIKDDILDKKIENVAKIINMYIDMLEDKLEVIN